MAEFTHIDLRAARDSRKMQRWKLAKEVGVSEDTVERWETGKQRPEPDDVGKIEQVLGIPGLWHRWMMSTYDSYRERNSETPSINHPAAMVMGMEYELADMQLILDPVKRDSVDGKIDDPAQWERFKEQLLRIRAATQQLLDWKPDDEI